MGLLGARTRFLSLASEMRVEEKPKFGFASMTPERQREIASLGGQAIPAHKRSFSTDRELARAAGRKGGLSVDPKKRSFSQDRKLAVVAGRKGGLSPRPPEKRSFSNVELAAAAGRKGGVASGIARRKAAEPDPVTPETNEAPTLRG